MATTTLVKRTVFGDQKVSIADVTFSSSYSTGGEAIDLGAVGLSAVNFAWVPPTAGYLIEYQYASNKLLVRTPTNAADGDAADAAPADEVASTTDLDAVTVRVMLFGV